MSSARATVADPHSSPAVPRGHWYVACPSAALGAGSTVIRLAGRDLALQRLADGTPWSVDLPLAERDGYVWGYLAQGDEAPGEAPFLAPFARKRHVFRQRTVRLAANYRLVLENSLDFAHGAHVHPLTQPAWLLHRLPGCPPMDATVAATPDGLRLEGRLRGRLVYTHEFWLPDRLRLVIAPTSRFAVDLVVHHVPEDDRTTRMEVLLSRPGWPGERQGPVLESGMPWVLKQDQAIVEAQQRALDSGRPVREAHCGADVATLLLRRVLGEALAGRWQHADVAPRAQAMRI